MRTVPRRRKSGAAGGVNKRNLTSVAIGAAVLGYVEKSDLAKSLPTIPAIGRKGSLAIAAYFVARQFRSPLAWDVCTAAVALAAYEFAGTGKISGDDGGYDDE